MSPRAGDDVLRGAGSGDSTSAPDSACTASRGRDPLRKPYARHRSRPAGLCSSAGLRANAVPSQRDASAFSTPHWRARASTTPSARCTSPGTAAQRPARRVACSNFHGPQPRCSSTQRNLLLRPVLSLPRAKLARSHWYLGRELLEACSCRHERAPQSLARIAGRDKPAHARTRLAPSLCKGAPHADPAWTQHLTLPRALDESGFRTGAREPPRMMFTTAFLFARSVRDCRCPALLNGCHAAGTLMRAKTLHRTHYARDTLPLLMRKQVIRDAISPIRGLAWEKFCCAPHGIVMEEIKA
jgi:hypothetical protein